MKDRLRCRDALLVETTLLCVAGAGTQIMKVARFQEWQYVVGPSPRLSLTKTSVGVTYPVATPPPGRQKVVRLVMVQASQRHVPQVVHALCATPRFTS